MLATRKIYDNIFWFLIDGLRPDYIHINENEEKNFIDELLGKGTVFTDVVTTGAGTYTSMHSIFTSLLPAYNGADGWTRKALRNFNQEIFTITDYFQLAGYETFGYMDTDEGRTVPMSGFGIWESSGYKNFLKTTDMGKTDRRYRFIKEVNTNKGNKFVYHHIDLLHDLNCGMGTVWGHAEYAKNVLITAREFEQLYNEYSISENDLVIISSDHGVILDKDFMCDGIENGDRQYEENVLCFFAMIGKDIAPQILSNRISALDLAPTLLHIALGRTMPGQGIDRYDYMQKGIYEESIFYREKNTYCAVPEMQSPLHSDLFYIRDGNWKYVFGENDARCEWLINLKENQDYQVNLKDEYPDLTKKYSNMVKEKIYGGKSFIYKSELGFNKSAVKKKFSLILQMDKILNETMESLLDLGGPYYEVVVYGAEEMAAQYKNYKVKAVSAENSEKLEEACEGEWIVYIKENGNWSEYFLSDLYRYIQCHKCEKLKINSKNYVAVRKEEINSCTYNEMFERGEIRTIRYPCREDKGKKYILFGCGQIGKEAMDYLGEERIYYFVDNNPALTGTYIYGKRVISYDELKEICNDYVIIIAASMETTSAYEIKEQLGNDGIYEYLYFDRNK